MKHSLVEQSWTHIEVGTALIQVQNISRVIESGANKTVILDNLNFTIPARSLFAINGPSGSGKSTILNILTGIDRPSSLTAGHNPDGPAYAWHEWHRSYTPYLAGESQHTRSGSDDVRGR